MSECDHEWREVRGKWCKRCGTIHEPLQRDLAPVSLQPAPSQTGTPTGTLEFMHEYLERIGGVDGIKTLAETHPAGLVRGLCNLLVEKDAELSQAKRDAERYRFIRSEEVVTDPRYYKFWGEFNMKLCRESRMDALIDAALAKREGEGEGEGS